MIYDLIYFLVVISYFFLCCLYYRGERNRYRMLFEDRDKRYLNFIEKFGHEHDLKE